MENKMRKFRKGDQVRLNDEYDNDIITKEMLFEYVGDYPWYVKSVSDYDIFGQDTFISVESRRTGKSPWLIQHSNLVLCDHQRKIVIKQHPDGYTYIEEYNGG